MCDLILDKGTFADFTSVSNVFIDEYMPKANGEFIKIYLHLLRLVSSGDSTNLSTEKIADKFNILESDVMRALNYWADQGLMSLTFNDQNELTGIKLESAIINRYFVKNVSNKNAKKDSKAGVNAASSTQTEVMADTSANSESFAQADMLASASGESAPSRAPKYSVNIIPAKKKYSAKEIASFSDNECFENLTIIAQTYLGKTLNSSDINSILYMMDGLRLDEDFIQYIMDTCISKGAKSLSSIEKQAVTYVKNNIYTLSDAKAYEKLHSDIYKSINKVFGISSKAPVKKEIDYVTKWTDTYGFSKDIILEACNRTMEHTHSNSFPYADSILTNWYQSNAMSLDEIEKLDLAHSKKNKEKYTKTSPKAKTSRPKNSHTFKEREYDYNNLESLLRNNQNKRIKQLLSDDGKNSKE